MVRSPILASTALALALALGPGFAGAAGDKPVTGQGTSQTGQSSKAEQQRAATEEYVAKAGAGDLFEVETGKLAAQRASSSSVKQFGRMMTQDHSASTDKIRQAATKALDGKVPPAEMTSHQRATTKRLMEAEGRAFDRLYVDAQIEAHREALQLHRGYAQSGSDPELKKVAAEIAPIVERHLAELRKISNTVLGSN